MKNVYRNTKSYGDCLEDTFDLIGTLLEESSELIITSRPEKTKEKQ